MRVLLLLLALAAAGAAVDTASAWLLCTSRVCAALFAVLALLNLRLFHWVDYWKDLPDDLPGPPCTNRKSWLGVALQINKHNSSATFVEWARRYGICKISMVGWQGVVFSDPEHISTITKHPDLLEKAHFGYGILKAFLGQNSLLLAPTEKWKPWRRMLAKAFMSSNLNSFVDDMVAAAKKAQPLLEAAPYDSKDVDAIMIRTAIDVIGQAMFSSGFDVFSESGENKLIQCVKTGAAEMQDRMDKPFHMFVSPLAQYRFWRDNRYLRAYFQKLISERRALLVADSESFKKRRLDLVDQMLLVSDEETGLTLSDEEIVDQCVTFLFAGNDTTGHTTAWALYLLATHPECEKKVLDELLAVLGDREPAYKDLGSLVYLGYVIKETLRMYPPVPVFSRNVSKDTTVNGIRLKKDTIAFCVTAIPQFDAKIFPKPGLFIPERWADEALARDHPHAFAPFALHQRNCIGMNFALLEIKVLLAVLLRRYSFQPDLTSTYGMTARITAQPCLGIHLFVAHRQRE